MWYHSNLCSVPVSCGIHGAPNIWHASTRKLSSLLLTKHGRPVGSRVKGFGFSAAVRDAGSRAAFLVPDPAPANPSEDIAPSPESCAGCWRAPTAFGRLLRSSCPISFDSRLATIPTFRSRTRLLEMPTRFNGYSHRARPLGREDTIRPCVTGRPAGGRGRQGAQGATPALRERRSRRGRAQSHETPLGASLKLLAGLVAMDALYTPGRRDGMDC